MEPALPPEQPASKPRYLVYDATKSRFNSRTRIGKRVIAAHVSPQMAETVKEIAKGEGVSIETLIREGVNYVLMIRGMPPVT